MIPIHESAEAHVTGEAVYVDDMSTPAQTLVGRVVYSRHAHARIVHVDLSAARRVPGVHAVLSAEDIPGENQMGPVVRDEPCLAAGEVTFVGQAVILIAAETEEQCREAERQITITVEQLDAILDLPTAIRRGSLLGPRRSIISGDVESAMARAPHTIRGEVSTGAQEHWYLETQVCLCVPGEGDEMSVFSSTQHPSETQTLVAEILGIPRHKVMVEVRRIGGGFGGKETQANHTACWTALLASATRRPVKIRLFRDDDMIMTGKRHRFLTRYEAGFDDDGNLLAVRFDLNSDGGAATDLSFAILERAMLHVDNAYYIPNLSVTGSVWKTNLPSNTALRGFGGPQAIAAMETVIDRVARSLHLDAAAVRRKNFYGVDSRNTTHYGQTVQHNRLFRIFDQLVESADYHNRREAVERYNGVHEFSKKGLALTPVKFGISFTTTFLNQAGALVNIYTDGTVLVNHGGVEMGQGLHTKMQGIAAAELGLSTDRVRVNATDTSKIPNTSATAASSGADLNGMAVKNAIETIKERIGPALAEVFTEKFGGEPTLPGDLTYRDDAVTDGRRTERSLPFGEAMKALHLKRISLSATGFYRTPTIGWDRTAGRGNPFYYYAFGMAVSEVTVDVLTGEHTIDRVDIVHDVGDSLNPHLDRGQIEGGFIQGVGWCTTEEIKWDTRGNLLTHSPDTYKIPTAADCPAEFHISMLRDAPNVGTIRQSKAVGEPPLMLAMSVWLAIKDALSAVRNHQIEPEFSLPATNEVIVLSAERLRRLPSLQPSEYDASA